jgi:hypothetical protein
MAHAPATQNAVTEDAFFADRQRIYGGFLNATVYSIVAVVIILAALGIFLL